MDRTRTLTRLIVPFLGCAACAQPTPPPRGEVLVVVDTDLAVPRVVDHVRIDVYSTDGRWLDSRELTRERPGDFPLSFSVYSDDDDAPKRVFVRVRAFPEGAVRDYRGERFTELGGVPAPAPEGFGPRLMDGDGVDRTPETEPDPGLAVDRLAEIVVQPMERATAKLILRAACSGSMAELGPRRTTCIENEGERVLVEPEPVTAGLQEGVQSLAAISDATCTSASPDRVCVPPGTFILGSRRLLVFPDLPPVPERVVRSHGFSIDKEEFTVGRYRALLTAGFSPAHPPKANEGELGPDFVTNGCTFSSAASEREDHALNCISALGAEEACEFAAGRLPSEAEWEYVATSAGKLHATLFPWGEEAPDCARAVYGRLALGGIDGVCEVDGSGPLPAPAAPGDLTPLGVHALAGGLGEWLRDDYAPYTDACWIESSNQDPECHAPPALRAVRGGSWAAPPLTLRAAGRFGASGAGNASFIGFRCVYPEGP
jgi:formylglycine-generating enzyme required for sulfatase activity